MTKIHTIMHAHCVTYDNMTNMLDYRPCVIYPLGG